VAIDVEAEAVRRIDDGVDDRVARGGPPAADVVGPPTEAGAPALEGLMTDGGVHLDQRRAGRGGDRRPRPARSPGGRPPPAPAAAAPPAPAAPPARPARPAPPPPPAPPRPRPPPRRARAGTGDAAAAACRPTARSALATGAGCASTSGRTSAGAAGRAGLRR